MDVAATLGRIEEQFEGGDPHGALGELGELVAEVAERSEPERAALLRELAARVDHEQPALGAHFALAAGALVEGGLDPRPLAEALVAPVSRALHAARRFVQLTDAYPDEPDAIGSDEEAVEVGEKILSGQSLAAIADEDDDAVASYFSLDTWYRPVITAWTRYTPALRRIQADASLEAPLADLAGRSEGAQWLTMLLRVPFDAPFVLLVPELASAYGFRVSGVSDVGQLLVLVADALAEPLAGIGVIERPSPPTLEVMRGSGPQQARDAYHAELRLYPWQALDPATGLPRDGAFTWAGPGGTGTHSLPTDFLPGDVLPFPDGTRVLILVGPRAPGGVGLREVPAIRSFAALSAHLDDVKELSPEATARWTRTVLAKKAS